VTAKVSGEDAEDASPSWSCRYAVPKDSGRASPTAGGDLSGYGNGGLAGSIHARLREPSWQDRIAEGYLMQAEAAPTMEMTYGWWMKWSRGPLDSRPSQGNQDKLMRARVSARRRLFRGTEGAFEGSVRNR
jgi:hypothetical protein